MMRLVDVSYKIVYSYTAICYTDIVPTFDNFKIVFF